MKKYIAFTLLILFAIFSFSCSHDKQTESILKCADNDVISYGENGFSVFGGKLSGRLKLHNSIFEELSITVYSENGKYATLSAAKGEEASERSVGGRLAAITITCDKESYSYALSKKGLDALLSSDADSIYILNNINNEGNLMISRPVSINSAASLNVDGTIHYGTSDAGKLVLEGNISAKGFTSSAPKSDIYIPEDLILKPDLYIVAKSLNGKELPNAQRKVCSLSELAELCKLPEYLDENTEIITLSGIEFKKDFTIPFPCSLKIEDDTKLNGHLVISTENEGEIRLFGDFEHKDITINAPKCNIRWDSPCTLDEAAKHFRAKSLNGFELKDYALGGRSSASILSATMKSEDSLCSSDIVWTAKKNTLFATINGVVAPSALKNAKLSFEIDVGSIEIDKASLGDEGGIDLLSPLGTFVSITDNNGKTRKYNIKTVINTKLPVVVINTENSADIVDRENYINAQMSIESDFSDNLPSTELSDIQIKGRGNSTWIWFDKKPYKIKFQNDVSLLGLCKGKSWVLLANYNDKTLMRNYIALEAAKTLDNMDCYATQYPVDVFLNGEYLGVYSLGEQIEVGDERIKLHENANSVDIGYLLEIGGADELEGESSFSTRFMNRVAILEPSKSLNPVEHKEYIKSYFALADGAVSAKNDYHKFIDIDSLIDWFIITEISFNSDGAMRRSVFMTKGHGEKIKMGPVWDYDIAFGNSNTDFYNYEAWCCLATEYNYVYENWLCSLMEDEEFLSRLRDRYNEIRDRLYACFMDSIDYAEEVITPSADANFEKWDILPYQVGLQPDFVIEYDTYEEQVEFLREFINKRFDFIDKQLNGE